MILADTSAWVEYLRATGSDVHLALRRLLTEDEPVLATTDVVWMEVLAGAVDDRQLAALEHALARTELLPVHGPVDYEDAAALYRRCRRVGETVRALTDCLIAAVAIRNDVPVLQRDRDFATLARHTPLRLA
jgi:predicted nucleic acid-binding protein